MTAGSPASSASMRREPPAREHHHGGEQQPEHGEDEHDEEDRAERGHRQNYDRPVIDEGTEFGARVARHLREDVVVWLTTVTPSGAPLPAPVWFIWDGPSW